MNPFERKNGQKITPTQARIIEELLGDPSVTQGEIARRARCTKRTVRNHAKRTGIKFVGEEREKKARNKELVRMRDAGVLWRVICEKFDIDWARAHRIYENTKDKMERGEL